MSRLDYVTIAIVAVCVAALVYLIYMTTNLLGDPGDSETTTETTTPSDATEDQQDDTYYFDDQGRIEGDDQSGAQEGTATTDSEASSGYDYQNGENLDKGRSASGGATAGSSSAEMDTRTTGVAEEGYSNTSSRTGSTAAASSGQYMVIAGTFTVDAYAKEMEQKLRGMGYNEVRLEPFDRGKYTVVLVDRFSSINDAKSLVGELESKGVKAYVREK